MIKFLITISIILIFYPVLLAQVIPNYSFENWSGGDPISWLTSDVPGFDAVTQSSDAYDGNFSAYMEVLGDISFSFIPTLQVIDPDSMNGIPVSQRYTRFGGYYKFTRMGIDFFNIQLFMYKNSVLIGTGEAPRAPVNNWTEFNVEINYFNSDIPDRAQIWLSISALGGGQGTVGSNGNVDSLWFGFITNGVERINKLPQDFYLSQNYPNPFNPSTKIEYSISEVSFVQLKIYDILGEEIAELVNEEQTAGVYRTDFNAGEFTSGIYFYTIKAGSFVETKKMILMK